MVEELQAVTIVIMKSVASVKLEPSATFTFHSPMMTLSVGYAWMKESDAAFTSGRYLLRN